MVFANSKNKTHRLFLRGKIVFHPRCSTEGFLSKSDQFDLCFPSSRQSKLRRQTPRPDANTASFCLLIDRLPDSWSRLGSRRYRKAERQGAGIAFVPSVGATFASPYAVLLNSVSYWALSAFFCTLPMVFLGSRSTMMIRLGTLKLAMLVFRCSINDSGANWP